MHSCPECGMACYCSGDIEDHDTGPEHETDCVCCLNREPSDDWERDFDVRDDTFFDGPAECGYPGCLMPCLHIRDECHNAQDVEAWFAEHEKQKPTCTRV